MTGKLLTLGASTVYAGVAAWCAAANPTFFAHDVSPPAMRLSALLSSWAVPSLATAAAAQAFDALSPRRILRRGPGWAALALGVVAGSGGVVTATAGLALLERWLPDAAVFAAAAAAWAVLALLPGARVRPGACPACGFSLEGATPAARGVCAECGVDVRAA